MEGRAKSYNGLKMKGDHVEEEKFLLEIVTDKVNMEVEADATGTLLKILSSSRRCCTSCKNNCLDW